MATQTSKSKKRTLKLTSNITLDSLSQWNKYLAVLYAAQGIIILILSVTRLFPVTTSFLGTDTLQTQAQGHAVLAAGSQHLFDVNLAFIVAAFFFIAAIAHGLVTTKLRPMYELDLKRGINKVRWVEYAFSASMMMVALALLVGIQDVSTLLMLFGLTVIANLLWLIMELHNQGAGKINWLSYIFGRVAEVITWIVMVIYLVSDGVYGAAVPGYVYWVFGSLFVLLAAVPVNMFLQYRKVGKWADYLYGERVYMILSFIAKTALAWQIFAGTLHP